MSYATKARTILKDNGYKKTQSRVSIIDILSNSDKALSFVDIVKQSPNKKLDEVTVYRFLHILEELHLVKKITSLRWYIKCDGDQHPHNHYFLVCNDCQNVQETVLHQEETIVNSLGIYPDQQCIEIVGKCKDCK